MPNWCQNNLIIEGKEEDLEDFVSKSKDGKFTLETYYPYETEDGEWDYGWCIENWGTKWDVNTEISSVLVYDNSPESPIDVEKTTDLIIQPAEYNSDGELEYDPKIKLTFDTAWGPPTNAIGKIAKDYPNLIFKHYYFEAGHWFAGYDCYYDGEDGISGYFQDEQLTAEHAQELGFDSFYY